MPAKASTDEDGGYGWKEKDASYLCINRPSACIAEVPRESRYQPTNVSDKTGFCAKIYQTMRLNAEGS